MRNVRKAKSYDQAQIIRRMVNRIQRLQEWNSDPKIAEFLETARVDLANVVNLMYQKMRKHLAEPRKHKIIKLYKEGYSLKEISALLNVHTNTINKVRKAAGLSRYVKRSPKIVPEIENSKCLEYLS